MKQTITAKIKILPNQNDKVLLQETMKQYTLACNFVSKHIFRTKDLNQSSLNKALYPTLRSEFDLKSQMAQSVLKTVIARYKTILKNQNEWIQPNFKKPQYDLVWNRDYSITENLFSVNTISGRVKLSYFSKGMEQYFNENYKFGTAKLVFKHGQFFLHVPVTYEINVIDMEDICHVVGIDRGINFLVATYDSHSKTGFVSGKAIKQKRAQYSKTRKQLQMRKTSSSRRRLKAIGQRENRWMHDINHQVSKALVENNPKHTLFVLEDLTNVRNATEKVHLKNRYVSVSWAFYDLEQKLKYKADRYGSKVINVNPAYTSQTCPKCGHTSKNNRNKKLHLFTCKNCGYSSNDDRIGAMNLYRMGIEHLVPDTVKAE